jgi:hypothetical protein
MFADPGPQARDVRRGHLIGVSSSDRVPWPPLSSQSVIVFDDPAARYVMLPLIERPNIAVVFSGMNAQPESYNESKPFMTSRRQPDGSVTGVYEKLYVI